MIYCIHLGLLLFWFVFHNFGPSDGSNLFEIGVSR